MRLAGLNTRKVICRPRTLHEFTESINLATSIIFQADKSRCHFSRDKSTRDPILSPHRRIRCLSVPALTNSAHSGDENVRASQTTKMYPRVVLRKSYRDGSGIPRDIPDSPLKLPVDVPNGTENNGTGGSHGGLVDISSHSHGM